MVMRVQGIVVAGALALVLGCALPAGRGSVDDATMATAHSLQPIQYRGREQFEVWPVSRSPLNVVRAGALAGGTRYDVPFYAAGVRQSQTVADVGCGKGRYSLRLADAVGETGFVYCRDIDPFRLAKLRKNVTENNVINIEVVQSKMGDVMLLPESIDVALLADVYQFVLRQSETKSDFMDSLYKAMKPGGIVVVTYVTWFELRDEPKWRLLLDQTAKDFPRYGFEPGRRLIVADEREERPALVLEFRRPT